MLQKNWTSIKSVFETLNNSMCNYVVLRNFENIDSDEIFIKNHEDIAFLTDDRKKLVVLLNAKSRRFFDNGIHYFILINNVKVKIDIREVGDCYYDPKWEIDMLKNKVINDLGCYVMDTRNYFYSLTYHALLQKNNLSKDYKTKLLEMSKTLNLNVDSENTLLLSLIEFVRGGGYSFMYPKDCEVPNRFYLLPKDIKCKGKFLWQIKYALKKILHLIARLAGRGSKKCSKH